MLLYIIIIFYTEGYRVMKGGKKVLNSRATVMLALLLSLFTLALPLSSRRAVNAGAETFGFALPSPDYAVDYLDYELGCPVSLYADEEVVAVTCDPDYYDTYVGGENEGRNLIVYFYGGRIYEQEIVYPDGAPMTAPEQLVRSGNRIYYSTMSVLKYVELGEFVEKSTQIGANRFAMSGDRLITLTNTGVGFFRAEGENFVRCEQPDYFDELRSAVRPQELLHSGRVYSTADHDYYFPTGTPYYIEDSRKDNRSANYITDIDGRVYFSDGSSIYKIEDDGNASLLYEGERILGISGYAGDLIFVDGTAKKLMRLSPAAGAEATEFLFDISIKTDAAVNFTDSPAAVTVPEDSRLHVGTLEGGAFDYAKTIDGTGKDEDFVAIGAVVGTHENVYLVLFGRSGYALVGEELAVAIDAEQPPFDRATILHDCNGYASPVDDGGTAIAQLKKGDEVTLERIYRMNGADYALVRSGDTKSFVLLGELKAGPTAQEGEFSGENTVVNGEDRTIVAIVITIISLAILIFALFVIFVQKDYIKL